MNKRTPPAVWLDKKRPTKEVLAELGLERRTAYMRYGPRGTLSTNGRKPGAPPLPRKRLPCPCCGAEGTFSLGMVPLKLGPVQQAIFNAVRDSDGLTIDQIVERVYGNMARAPGNPDNCVLTLISKVNGKLRPVGLKIVNGTWGGPYCLVQL